MKEISVKNLSLLALILMVASTATAAIVPNKSNVKRANNGTLRAFSFTDAGVDQDAVQAIISCKDAGASAVSCTATVSLTTTGFFAEDSYIFLNGLYHQTIGNTSYTAAIPGDQNSVLVTV